MSLVRIGVGHYLLAALLSLSGAVACSSSDDDGGGSSGPKRLKPLASASLVTDGTLEPVKERPSQPTELVPKDPDSLDQLLADGYGDLVTGPAETIHGATLDGAAPPAANASATLLTRWVHLADTQLADDESPARLANFDAAGATAGAFRPQEAYECYVLRAAVRTINAVGRQFPLDFVLLGGDNADNAQDNENDWFLAILNGTSSVECDSGADDDPVRGANNDPKDPLASEGLDVPWKWVSGNHDVLNQGNFPTAPKVEVYVGAQASGGTRDWSQPGGPIVSGEVIPDPRRKPLSRAELVAKVAGDADGHGLDDATVSYGAAFYTFDAPSSPLRFVVLDTTPETGSADGMIRQEDVDGFIKPALAQAQADGKWVIVTSHHPARSFTDGSGFGGKKQGNTLTTDDWRELLGSYPNVLAHLAAHTHVYTVNAVHPTSGHAYWEIETDSLADFPSQARMFELWDQGDGNLTLRAIPFDYAADDDPLAAAGRARAVVDYTSGWLDPSSGPGEPTARAVELWMPKPATP